MDAVVRSGGPALKLTICFLALFVVVVTLFGDNLRHLFVYSGYEATRALSRDPSHEWHDGAALGGLSRGVLGDFPTNPY